MYRAAFQCTMVGIATLVALWLLYEIRQLVVSIALALVFAAAISPWVRGLEARRVPRALAILFVYAALLGAIALILFLALPPLIKESVELFGRLVASARDLEAWLELLLQQAGQSGAPPLEMDKAVSQALQASSALATGLLRVTFSVAGAALSFLLVLAIAFYWLVERDDVEEALVRLVAPDHRERFLSIWREIEAKLGAYVRGQLLDALAVGALTFLGLSVLRVDFALPLAAIAASTGLIPIVGATLGAVPAVLIGFSQSPQTALLVLGLYLVVQQIEGSLLAPKIMQQSVGVSPLTVLVAIVIGGSLMGVVGAMLAIPSAAAVQVLLVRLVLDRRIAAASSRTLTKPPAESPAPTRPA